MFGGDVDYYSSCQVVLSEGKVKFPRAAGVLENFQIFCFLMILNFIPLLKIIKI